MNKVGIVTLFGLYNFGNRLQNYAVQEILKNYDCNAMTILSSEMQPKTYIKFWLKSIKNGTLKRSLKFWKFNKKYILTYTVSKYPICFPKMLSTEFDYFVVGSDQVWNPDIRQNQRDNFFLSFAEKKQRIAIAPSLTVPSIPDQWKSSYIRGLNGFSKISVRENNSVQVIRDLTGKEAVVLADPTMIVPVEHWKGIEKKVAQTDEYYLLTLFLGGLNEKRRDNINSLAASKGLTIIDLNDKKWIGIGPDEFLYLVHHANIVCTDSFHCLVFSILFDRSFVAFDRNLVSNNDVNARTGSRIETLLQKFSKEAIIQDDYSDFVINHFSYDIVQKVLESERKQYHSFLADQFNKEKE